MSREDDNDPDNVRGEDRLAEVRNSRKVSDMTVSRLDRLRGLFLLAMLAASGTACTRPSIPVAREPHPPRVPATVSFGNAFFLIGKPVVFADGLTVELKEINDSRCPPKVQCIWAGELTVNLAAHGGDIGDRIETFTLGALTGKHRVVASYDFVLTDASTTTAAVIVTKPGIATH